MVASVAIAGCGGVETAARPPCGDPAHNARAAPLAELVGETDPSLRWVRADTSGTFVAICIGPGGPPADPPVIRPPHGSTINSAGLEVTTTEGEAPVGLFIFPPTQGGVVEFGGLALGRFDAVPRDTCELHGEESASIVLEGCGVLLYFHWEVPLSAQTGSIIDLVDVRVRERITETENSMEQADLGFYLTSAHVYNGQLSIRFATNRPSDTSAPKLTFELRSVLATVDGALVEMLTPEQAASDPASVDLVQNN